MPTSASDHTSRKTDAHSRSWIRSTPTAGIQTSAVPTIGTSDTIELSTPNTTGEGNPTMAKPIPRSVP